MRSQVPRFANAPGTMSRALLIFLPFVVACPSLFEDPKPQPVPPGLYDAGPDAGFEDAGGGRDAAITTPDAGENLDATTTATTGWLPTPGPSGGWMRGLAADPRDPSKLYASSFFGGMWTRDDRSEQWTRALLDPGFGVFASVFAFDPQDPAILFGAGVGLMRTTDGGQTWDRFSSLGDDQVYGLIIDPRDGLVLYAATEDGMFKSTDGGFNFHAINNGLPAGTDALALVMHPTDFDILYVGTGNGVYVSSDGGASWSAAATGIETQDVSTLAIDPLDPRVLYAGTRRSGTYRTLDGGASWTQCDTWLGVTAIAVDTALPGRVYVMTLGGGMIASRDHGDTWSSIDFPFPGTLRLFIAQGAPSTIYAATEADGIYQSRDSGTTWQRFNEGLDGTIVDHLALDSSDPRIVYAATPARVFKTATHGDRWSDPMVLTPVNDLAIEAGAPQVVYAATIEGVVKTIDGGLTWTRLPTAFGLATSVATDPRDRTVVYAGFSGGELAKSTDGGQWWELSASGLTGNQVESIVVDPRRSETIYVATDDGIFKSIDGAATWNLASGGLPRFNSTARALVIDGSDSDVLYVGASFGVFKTIDGGASWIDVSPALPAGASALAISASDSEVLYAGGSAGSIYRTSDGGASWRSASMGIPENVSIRSLIVDPTDSRMAYAGVGDFGVYRTSTGGL